MKTTRHSDAVSARLRELGNPYASLQISEEAEEGVTAVASPEESVELTLTQSQNPWATLYFKPDPKDSPASADLTRVKFSTDLKISKSEFQRACRAIFRCYIPEVEKGRIRAHHRDFILRNESRSANKRYRMLQELRRYDLSAVPGIQAHFNRERGVFTEAKLRSIENDIGNDD